MNGTSTGSPGAQRSSRARPSASDDAPHGGPNGRVDPAIEIGDVLGVERQARREREPARRGRLAQPLDLGPGRLGVDVIDGDRRDAAPVVDPRIEEQREVVVGEVRRRLHVPVGARARRGPRRPSTAGRRASRPGWPAILVPGLARKFCTITSPRWPYSSPRALSASSASIRSSRVSPIPIRIPLVNGIASSPASRIVSSRAAGTLSGDAQCGPPFCESRSETVSSMIPIEADTGRSSSSSSRLITPGFRCGSSPVSSSTRPAQCARYSIVLAKPSTASSSRATR